MPPGIDVVACDLFVDDRHFLFLYVPRHAHKAFSLASAKTSLNGMRSSSLSLPTVLSFEPQSSKTANIIFGFEFLNFL